MARNNAAAAATRTHDYTGQQQKDVARGTGVARSLTSSAPSPERTILTPIALIFLAIKNMGVAARMVVVSYVSIMRTTCDKQYT